jgi:hypothetical protein
MLNIREDIANARLHDPAARSSFEVWVVASGLHAVWAHRWHHWLWNHGFKFLCTWDRSAHGYGLAWKFTQVQPLVVVSSLTTDGCCDR